MKAKNYWTMGLGMGVPLLTLFTPINWLVLVGCFACVAIGLLFGLGPFFTGKISDPSPGWGLIDQQIMGYVNAAAPKE